MSVNTHPNLLIQSGQGNYGVSFIQSIEDAVVQIAQLKNALILIDGKIVQLYRQKLLPALEAHPTFEIEASENEKTPEGILRVLSFLQSKNAVKDHIVVAIGGGIIQDIATFAAHVYYRGLRWHYYPTTLLGMADSCIGAKCGINFGPYKNQLGVFHSPAHVTITLPFLDTLHDTEIRSGYGEIIKLHLTRNPPEDFLELESIVSSQGWRNKQLINLIERSLATKKGVIEEDEYERDLRRILNYGHTFGHALEAVTQHQIPHGLAVAWGIDLVNFLAMRWGLFPENDFTMIHRFIADHFSWKLSKSVNAKDLIEATKRDKKVASGKINLILPDRIGSLRIVPTTYDSKLEKAVEEYLAIHNAISWS